MPQLWKIELGHFLLQMKFTVTGLEIENCYREHFDGY